MGNTAIKGSNPFATNDIKGDNLRQERELKAILRPKEQPVKFAGEAFNPVALTDTQLAEINRAENEKGGMTLCVGDACNVRRKGRTGNRLSGEGDMKISPIINPNE
jgi:hypothetical protein